METVATHEFIDHIHIFPGRRVDPRKFVKDMIKYLIVDRDFMPRRITFDDEDDEPYAHILVKKDGVEVSVHFQDKATVEVREARCGVHGREERQVITVSVSSPSREETDKMAAELYRFILERWG